MEIFNDLALCPTERKKAGKITKKEYVAMCMVGAVDPSLTPAIQSAPVSNFDCENDTTALST